jgi:hypothetical protein
MAVVRLIVWWGMKPIWFGLAVGLPLRAMAGHVMLDVRNPVPYVGAAAVLLGALMTDAVGPARRAAGADPMQALRHDQVTRRSLETNR